MEPPHYVGMYPETTMYELRVLARVAGALQRGDDEQLDQLTRQSHWPLHRVLLEIERAGITERPVPLPLR